MAERAIPFYPRARIYRNEIIHPAFDYEIYTNEIVGMARARGISRLGATDSESLNRYIQNEAGIRNLLWVGIEQNKLEAEGLFDYENIDPPAFICGYKVIWRNTRARRDWFYTPSPEEEAYRTLERARIQGELDELSDKENKDQADLDEIAALENLLEQLSEGGDGFLETTFNWGGTMVEGIFWGLGVPNISASVKSTFKIDGGVALRLKRLEAPKGQATDFSYEIELGDLYALVIGEDGNSAEFVHYRPGVKNRKALLEELQEIKDSGRLTPDNQLQILGWKEDIQIIRKTAKERGTGQKELTPEESAQIKAIEKQIDDLQESKRGLTEGNEARKREIEDLLIIDRMSFALQEAERSLLNVPVDISFIPLESGSVVIHVNDEQKIYENKEWQRDKPDDKPYPPHTLTGHITLKSSGGKWGVLYGDVQHSSGEASTPAFPISFVPEEEELRWSINGTAPAGTSLEATLEAAGNGLYRIKITMDGDKRTPEFYGVELYIPAALSDEETELWNSQTHGANPYANSGNHITDVVIQSDRLRGRAGTLHVNNADNVANLLIATGGAAIDLSLLDVASAETRVLQRYGKVVTNSQMALDDVGADGAYLAVAPSLGNEAQIEFTGVRGFLDKEIKARFSCDGLLVNDALRSLARDAELPPERYAGIPGIPTPGLNQIKPSRVGKPFDVKPSEGTKYDEWMQQLVKDHAPRFELWENADGLQLTRRALRARPDLAYTTTGNAKSKLRFRRKAQEFGGLVLKQDTREYYTSATFYGKKDPLSGRRFSATASILQATDKRFEDSMFFTGEENHYTAPANDGLQSDADCRLAAREFLNITPLTPQGLPPWYLEGRVDFDESVLDGDLVTVNGVKFLIDGVDFAALDAGDGALMTLSLRLAEDKRVSLLESD